MFAIGNDELGPPIGETVECPHCGGTHRVEYGEKVLKDGTKEPSRLLGFYRCGGHAYLCAIGGMSIVQEAQ